MTFDLIYGLPGQTADAWKNELGKALGVGAKHVSLYQLTIEPGTAFDVAVRQDRWCPPGDDLSADLFDIAQEMTAAAGLYAYEVSNHAAPGAESKHNLIYWTGQDYVGVGPGAHGRITEGSARIATETYRRPEEYLSAIEATGTGANVQSPLDAEAQLIERMTMGLRLADGLLFNDAELDALGARTNRIKELVAHELIDFDGNRLKTTADGRRVLNAVLLHLLG